MPNPWDRPPIPHRGDEHENSVFANVGCVRARWEAVEFELSRLHTWFGGKLDDQALMAEYGKGPIFRERAKNLERRAEKHFIAHPNQRREGEFRNLLSDCRNYAERRNDIAHGMVFRIDRITWFREQLKPKLLKREHYALVPPLYAIRYATQKGYPAFAYTSKEMIRIGQRLVKLRHSIAEFREG